MTTDKKSLLEIRVSKIMHANGGYLFQITTNLESYPLITKRIVGNTLPVDGPVLSGENERRWGAFDQWVYTTLRIIFENAREEFGITVVPYKMVFSDRYIATGNLVPASEMATGGIFTKPMDEHECDFFFYRIPHQY